MVSNDTPVSIIDGNISYADLSMLAFGRWLAFAFRIKFFSVSSE
jgi:hypothetical protein